MIVASVISILATGRVHHILNINVIAVIGVICVVYICVFVIVWADITITVIMIIRNVCR